MAELSGLSYIVVGIMVFTFSFYFNVSTGTQKFVLFLYTGLIMTIIGIIKIVKKKKSEFNPKNWKYCHYCGSIVRNFEKFCSKCGRSLFVRRK